MKPKLTTPKAGELWGHKSPVFVIKPRGRKFVLATLHVDPDTSEYTADRLAKKFRQLGYKKLGSVVSILLFVLCVSCRHKPEAQSIKRDYLVSFMAENKDGGIRHSYRTVTLTKTIAEWTAKDVDWCVQALRTNDMSIGTNLVILNIIPLAR